MAYDEDFLPGHQIALPTFSDSIAPDLFQGGFVHHTRISMLFNSSRGFTACSAHNIDGSSLPDSQWTSRSFRFDPKIKPNRLQVDNDRGYRNNHWDRGHMARRKSMSWGDPDVAAEAERESDFYSNICPQHENLHDMAWGEIEDWMIGRAAGSRACVFTGPVFTPDDPEITNAPGETPIRIPAGFWKIIAVIVSGKVRAAGFLVWQRDYDSEEPFAFQPVLEQVRITTIEVLTGLTFAQLRKFDPLLFDSNDNLVSMAAGRRGRFFESAAGWPLELTEEAIERFSRPAAARAGSAVFSPGDIVL